MIRFLQKCARHVAFTAMSVAAMGIGSAFAQPENVRVAVNNTLTALPVLVAERMGFFQANELDVEYEVIHNITLIPAGLGQNWDIGFSVAPIMLHAANSGLPIVAVAGDDKDYDENDGATLRIIASPDISSVSELTGKRIGTPTLVGNLNLATKAWLRANDVDPDTLQYVQVATPNLLDQLRAGLVDAVQLVTPFTAIAADEGFSDLGSPIKDAVGLPITMTWWIANREWAVQHPEILAGFRKSLDQANNWIVNNKDEARAILAEFTGMDSALVSKINLTRFDTRLELADIVAWGELMEREGGFVPNFEYESLVLR